MSPASRFLSACALGLALGACKSSSLPVTTACTPNLLPALRVTVVDARTGAPPQSATLIARSEAFVDSVGPISPYTPVVPGVVLVLTAATERPGTYDLTVHAPGYREWTRTGVRVTADPCHVRQVDLTAELQT